MSEFTSLDVFHAKASHEQQTSTKPRTTKSETAGHQEMSGDIAPSSPPLSKSAKKSRRRREKKQRAAQQEAITDDEEAASVHSGVFNDDSAATTQQNCPNQLTLVGVVTSVNVKVKSSVKAICSESKPLLQII